MLNSTVQDVSPKVSRLESTESLPDLSESFWESFWRPHLNISPFSILNYPNVNVYENDDEVHVEAELPGMDAQDFEVSFQNNAILLKGEKKLCKEGENGSYRKIECRYGSFHRVIPVSSEVDEDTIKAKLEKGLLTLTMSKKEEAKKKRIEIK